MKDDRSETDNNSFLFQVDILVSARTNGEALERLLHVLNAGEFADFRVGSGIQLGQVIEEALAKGKRKTESAGSPATQADQAKVAAAVAKAKDAVAKANANAPVPPKTPEAAPPSDELEQRIRQYIETNKLIRLNVNKGRGIKLNIPCRMISFDKASQLLTVYHVDEKQVHSFKLFEIDDFVE
ncbi:hypothetical protein GE107_16990 [Cohnella sp. CFH 77786]|uniref:hypothetical protein n=1 Tax=Cohnella sp. CFH 77786 TaxID=2662265 RepID=UPI001C60E2AA|nr:hypothetical protein [Cohnella sp. CFH 77786]MBW5447753.1 hypothetical protein [Cohnella sp. CFH 77786]